MIKKLRKSDYIFLGAFVSVFILHIVLIVFQLPSNDETFYATIPFRLVNGDSLIQHEWHLTQFSSVFSYLPVRFWMMIKGSTEGLIIFLRIVYLMIHSVTPFIIYGLFRSINGWAVLASMLYYIVTPYRIHAISYHSMFVFFLLLFTLTLMLIYRKNEIKLCVLAGFCYGACCVSNPLFCFVFLLYLIACVLWTQKYKILKTAEQINRRRKERKQKVKNKTSKHRRNKKEHISDNNTFESIKSYDCFFNKKAILFFSVGITIAAVISIIFFLSTGGTISSIFDNIENLLNASEYSITKTTFGYKFDRLVYYIKSISFNLAFLLPLLFVVLLFDKKRQHDTHRIAYLISSVVISVIFLIGMLYSIERLQANNTMIVSMPFSIISLVCYILTNRKNKAVFFCVWCPCILSAVFLFIAANTYLSAMGVVLHISHIAGAIFAHDLLVEMIPEITKKQKIKQKNYLPFAKTLICIGLGIQFLFNGYMFFFDQNALSETQCITEGPLKGIYLSDKQADMYHKLTDDMNIIKDYSEPDAPLLILSNQSWMYLYAELPIATNTTLYYGQQFNKEFEIYYKNNPDKLPKYIYIPCLEDIYFMNVFVRTNENDIEEMLERLNEMFYFTEEPLSNGILLTVTGCKFSVNDTVLT